MHDERLQTRLAKVVAACKRDWVNHRVKADRTFQHSFKLCSVFLVLLNERGCRGDSSVCSQGALTPPQRWWRVAVICGASATLRIVSYRPTVVMLLLLLLLFLLLLAAAVVVVEVVAVVVLMVLLLLLGMALHRRCLFAAVNCRVHHFPSV